MNQDYPKTLQLEVTNKCNLKCQMCIRHVWNAKPSDMNLNLYMKIAKSEFPRIQRLVLYGLGEPFMNPNILEMLSIANKQLPGSAQIVLSTNGSLLNPTVADKVIKEIGVDSISFSIDTFNMEKFGNLRSGVEPVTVIRNFRYIAGIKGQSKRELELGVESVVTEDNLSDLPDLVRVSAENNADFIIASHAIPYTEEIFVKTVYATMSKRSIEIAKPSLDYGWPIIHRATLELFGMTYGTVTQPESSNILLNFWRSAEENGYWINLPLLFILREKIERIGEVEEIFRQSEKIAHEYQIDLRLPSIYPDAKRRSCPYIKRNALVVRCDGLIFPCQELMYPHPTYVNAHRKYIYETSFGDLNRENLEAVWNKTNYVSFRKTRENMVSEIPWCGDCAYSSLGCYYVKTNELDCQGNEHTCAECLYSAGIAQCNI